MSNDPEHLKRAFAQAAEIASVVPEAMQEAAFNRALDQIPGVTPPPPAASETEPPAPGASRSVRRQQEQIKTQASQEEASPAQALIAKVNRTAYPDVFNATHVVDRALRVLRLAEEDFGIEWLSAPEIAQILKEKFRLPTTHQAVRQALERVPQYVDTQQVRRGSRGRPVLAYRIMAPGIAFLDVGGSASEATDVGRSRTRRATATRRPRGRGTARTSKGREGGSGDSRTSGRQTPRNRPGPKQSLSELIADGFFDEPRTIGQAQEQLRHKKGRTFTVQELSPALVRLLRDGSLDREQNESGQYEYRRH